MSEEELSEEEIVEAIYEYAAEQMKAGTPPHEIETKLVEQGLDAESAKAVVGNLTEAQTQSLSRPRSSGGTTSMVIGGLICVAGIAITVFSYAAASSGEGGGSYVVAWGAVVFGAIQFFRGFAQMVMD